VAAGDFQTGFLLVMVLQLVALVLASWLPEIGGRPTLSIGQVLSRIPSVARSRAILLTSLWTLGISVSPALYLSALVPHFRESGFSPFEIGLTLTVFFCASSVTGFSFGQIFRRHLPPSLYAFCMAGLALVFALLAWSSSLVGILVLIAMNGFFMSIGVNLRLVLTAQAVGSEQRGVAAAFVGSFWSLGLLVGPFTFGLLAAREGMQVSILSAAAWALLLAITATPLWRRLTQVPLSQPERGS
jgi:predicted MFS family arabinose efflux permease